MRKENKLRVLHAVHFPLEGAGTGHYVHSLASGLVKSGHEVGVVYAHVSNSGRSDTSYDRFPVNFGEGELDFSFPVFESHPLGGDLNFGNMGNDKYLKYHEAFASELDRAIDVVKPDVVNVHHGWVLGDMLSRKGIPYVVTLHGTEGKAFDSYPQYREIALNGLRCADGIVALTDDHRVEAVDKYGIDYGKFSVITSGVDTDFFLPKRVDREKVLVDNGVGVEGDAPVVLYVGRLTEIKGVEYLVDAAVGLKEGGKSPKILVAGDGVLKNQLLDVKDKYGLSDLNFLGLKNSSQILDLYNAADLVVVPSLSECFPLVPVEGMACGTPFVSTNISGGLNVQASGLEGVVSDELDRDVSLRVSPKDSDALGGKIEEVLELKLKDRMMGSIRKLSEGFSLEKMIDNTSDAYSSVVFG